METKECILCSEAVVTWARRCQTCGYVFPEDTISPYEPPTAAHPPVDQSDTAEMEAWVQEYADAS